MHGSLDSAGDYEFKETERDGRGNMRVPYSLIKKMSLTKGTI